MALGDVIGRLSVVLGLDTAAFETGARRAARTTDETGSRMEKLGARVGGAAKALVGLGAAFAGSELVGQIKAMSLAGLEAGKQIDIFAKLAGSGAEEFQRAAYAAKTVGIESEKLADIYKDVNDKVGDFLSTGGGEMADFFEKIAPKVGVTAEMFRGLSGPQALQLFVSSLQKANLNQAEMTFYMESIADDATRLLPLLLNNGAAFVKLGEDAKKAGIIMSEADVQKAVVALDKYNAMLEVVKVKQASMAAQNSEGILKGLTAWEEFKLKGIEAFGKLAEEYDTFQKQFDEWDAQIPDPWDKLKEHWTNFSNWWEGAKVRWNEGWAALGAAVSGMVTVSVQAMQRLYQGVKTWVWDKLNAVWDGAKKKIEEASRAFYNLYDAVVGHSYIPDMVDGIALQMARLDGVMVKPIKNATEAGRQAFQQFQKDVQATMENLFPESRDLADFRKQLGDLDRAIATGGKGTGFSVDQLQAGRSRLISGASADLLSNVPLPMAEQLARFGQINIGDTQEINEALKKLSVAANDNADQLGVANVKVAKSFKDMADQTLSALDRVTSAIKGGGFLDILSAVIGLGMQLGSAGLFGKGLQTRLNSGIPGFASGTSFAPGGLALVGERGPELVNLPRGSQVIPNHALGKGGGGAHITFGVDPRNGNIIPFIDGRIASAAPGIAAAGAQGGEARLMHRQRRRVA